MMVLGGTIIVVIVWICALKTRINKLKSKIKHNYLNYVKQERIIIYLRNLWNLKNRSLNILFCDYMIG